MSTNATWVRNAVLAEAPTFDPCNAHQPGNGEYHYHDNPTCLRLQLDDNIERVGQSFREKTSNPHHSPILGWANDGLPIYGPYGRDEKGTVRRMRSSFRLRQMTQRKTLAPWAAALHNVSVTLPADQFGPPVSKAYPLGWYIEDFEYVEGLGDLDLYNGRFAITPDFPKGTYAYYVSIDEDGLPAFPYVIGRQYYGQPIDRRMQNSDSAMQNTSSEAQDYFSGSNSDDPRLTSWLTQYNQQSARVVLASQAASGAKSIWPGQDQPVLADVQKVAFTKDSVIVYSSGLASHIMGPWYDPQSPDGIFPNFPRDTKTQAQIPRNPKVPQQKVTNGLGPLGRWVNGVALFNMLDGAAYSTAAGRDEHGGPPRGQRPPNGHRPPPQ